MAKIMILGIIQARLSSQRLPKKTLQLVAGEPMLSRQIDRRNQCTNIDKIIVATSTNDEDDSIDEFCISNNIQVFRGDLNDVLDRFYKVSIQYNPDHVVRLTGDCPLTDPSIIDKLIDVHIVGGFDYTSNTLNPTYPDGLDVEVMKFSVLVDAWKHSKLKSEREHVTPYIKNSGKFTLHNVESENNYAHLRWTVDEQEDLSLIREIFNELLPKSPNFTSEEIINLFLRRPDLEKMNNMHTRDYGYKKSLKNDLGSIGD